MPIMPADSPIVTQAPGANLPTATVPVVSQTTDPTYDGVAVDTSYIPRASLLTYVEGSKWTVQYYRQLIGSSNELSPTQTSRPGAYQQYELIHNMLFRVTQALSTSQDTETKSMVLNGAAITMNGLIPNVGDEFTADSGDGHAAIFVITASDKKSFLKDALYQVEYELRDYATPELIAGMNARVVQEATYVAGNLMIGMNPIIANSALLQMQQLQTQLQLLIAQYFRNFFSVEYQTLLVPDQQEACYDTFVVHAMLDFVSTGENVVVPKIRAWNVDGDQALKVQTLWDCLRNMRADFMPLISQKMGMAQTTRVLSSWPYFMSAYFSGITWLIYPSDARTDVDSQYVSYGTPVISPLAEGQDVSKDLGRLINSGVLSGFSYQSTGVNGLPDIVPVTADQYYVFSRGFYQNPFQPASTLEQLTMQALQGQAVDLAQLLRLATNATVWGNLERFYYVPVLIALIKANIGTI